ncbi:helix-turn-helix domain-containing protein [Gluconobacter cerevisiae]|uniref:Helix-turn-helix domain-containing protein n=1 Tax=Gluconobacter cerevisiae TaxID=1379734 RepID=A0ABR9YF75_9PROT|nr:helix-turn-helix domain-containing protein [Gluconobacter cerevisiae]MBF0877274.1 helix-turn-helix domain-containing protein [Gluconobacter cerevisiae]
MSKSAFDKIAAGLDEAIAIAEGTMEPAQLHVPAEIDVKAIRNKVGMTQEAFASAFCFTVHQIRQWEQGRVRPLGAMRAYLMFIDKFPREVKASLVTSVDDVTPARRAG